jgi:pyruvate,water dikinase
MHKPLDRIVSNDLGSVGGKSYNCARLRQAGFPVPDGVAIGADATAEEIHSLIEDPWLAAQPADAQFAVRSSGIGQDSSGHSFAGIHETYLNVARDRIVEHVLLCRDSGRSTPAAAYRAARGVEGADHGPAIGVLVQRMVAAETSGVAFTVNPVTGADEIVINAAPGLGEALVSGLVTPDEFTVGKREGRILSARRAGEADSARSPSLADAQIQALAALLVKIEQHYGRAQDIEWCHDGRQFWIVQSRPVTTNPRVLASPARPDTEWTRANLVEVFPEQLSPQCLAVYDDMLNRGQRKFMGRLLAPEAELGPVFGIFLGRMLNLSQMRRVAGIIGAPSPACSDRSATPTR